ncbi:hypothetical protein U9M48_043630, partial [Paspalum notatum var. saurae]
MDGVMVALPLYVFGCGVGSYPFRYIGIPMHHRRISNKDRREVDNRFEKKFRYMVLYNIVHRKYDTVATVMSTSPLNISFRRALLKVPLKTKIFIWLLLRGVILTKDNLIRKRWQDFIQSDTLDKILGTITKGGGARFCAKDMLCFGEHYNGDFFQTWME